MQGLGNMKPDAAYKFWKMRGMSTRAARCLVNNGVNTEAQRRALTHNTVLSWKDVGRVTAAEIVGKAKFAKFALFCGVIPGVNKGQRFFSTNHPEKDQTKLLDGTVAYEIIGYADTVKEAQDALGLHEPETLAQLGKMMLINMMGLGLGIRGN
jgi:hypothetical protein